MSTDLSPRKSRTRQCHLTLNGAGDVVKAAADLERRLRGLHLQIRHRTRTFRSGLRAPASLHALTRPRELGRVHLAARQTGPRPRHLHRTPRARPTEATKLVRLTDDLQARMTSICTMTDWMKSSWPST